MRNVEQVRNIYSDNFETGSLCVLTGQGILRAASLDGYTSPYQGSLQLGATGAAIISPVVGIVYSVIDAFCRSSSPDDPTPRCNLLIWLLRAAQATALGAAAGGIGADVLRSHGCDVMDPLYAARAGALGGVVLGPGETIPERCHKTAKWYCFFLALQVGIIVGVFIFFAILKALPCSVSCWNDRTVETGDVVIAPGFSSTTTTRRQTTYGIAY